MLFFSIFEQKTAAPIGAAVQFSCYYSTGGLGMTRAAMMYANKPHPAKNMRSNHIKRTIVESILRYCASPPHTPAIFLSVVDL